MKGAGSDSAEVAAGAVVGLGAAVAPDGAAEVAAGAEVAAAAVVGAVVGRHVQVGDVLRFEGRCAGVDGARVRLEISARNQRGEDVLKGAVAEGRVAER